MNDFLGTAPTWLLSLGLLLTMSAANEFGFFAGRRWHQSEPDSSRTVTNALKASVFALVALLLGFSFSMTASRHDLRRRVVLDEANAIGTCALRAGLLEEPQRSEIRKTLREYLDQRIAYFELGVDPEQVALTSRAMDMLLATLWQTVEAAGLSSGEQLRVSQIVPAANEVIDQSTTRAWAAGNHLPASVLLLLVVCVIVSNVLVGHSSGQTNRRHLGLWLATNLLFSLVLFTVLDFDRPRRGIIQVDHSPLIDLRSNWELSISPPPTAR